MLLSGMHIAHRYTSQQMKSAAGSLHRLRRPQKSWVRIKTLRLNFEVNTGKTLIKYPPGTNREVPHLGITHFAPR